MQVRVITAFAVSVLLGQGAMAQQSPGPAELPPDSFTEPQFVDSTGCVFLRTGLDDQIVWVPRVTPDGKPLCGYAPSRVAAAPAVQQAAAQDAARSTPAPAAAEARPTATPAKKTRRKPASAYRPAPMRCAVEAPLLARVALVSGGKAVMCLSDAARMVPQTTVLRLEDAIPLAPPGAGTVVICPRGAGVVQRVPLMSVGATLLCTAGTGSLAGLSVPRVKAGAQTVPDMPGRFVQVASFVQPANAERTKAWLARLGLPVATDRLIRRGQEFEVIFAGPFFTADTADATLALVRAAGFDDALLR